MGVRVHTCMSGYPSRSEHFRHSSAKSNCVPLAWLHCLKNSKRTRQPLSRATTSLLSKFSLFLFALISRWLP